jgi:two-component system sensor histidine kinase HydH
MVAMIYLFVAVFGLVLAWRSLSASPHERARREFAVLAVVVALVEGAFTLVLFPGVVELRWAWIVAGAFLPVTTLQVLDRISRAPGDPRPELLGLLWVATPAAAVLFLALDLSAWAADPGVTPPKVLFGVAIYLAFAAATREFWKRSEASPFRVERTRLRYLLVLMILAIGFSLIEGAVRVLSLHAADFSAMEHPGRAMELQGRIPPLGALFTGLFLYCLYLVISLERLLDLQELFSRLASVATLAAILVGVDFVAVIWLESITDFPLYTSFQVFIASVLFLLAYDPLRERVKDLIAQVLNRRGQQLEEALDEVEQALPKVISLEELGQVVLGRLHASGRFPAASLYLHDPDRGRVQRTAVRSTGRYHTLPVVALSPFGDGFAAGEGAYTRQSLEVRRQREGDEGEAASRLRMMDAMSADVVLPLTSGELVLGWLALKDEDWSDGLAHDELVRLERLATRAALLVENLRNFEAVKDQARLAALGTMSAGLAHEIRNPLAGIKGAAQFLQGEDMPPAAGDFLQIILDEVDRLNTVVSGFLDYARPLVIEREEAEVNAVVSHVLSLIRAEGLPEEIVLDEELGGDLPRCEMDTVKIQQVLFNLVRNAIQAMPAGGRVRVSTRVGRVRTREGSAKALCIDVEDQGAGISRENMKELFIPFFTTKPGGTGLGLAICQRIIRAHEGELKVRSTPGRGSVFSVCLPLELPVPASD